MKKIDYTVLDPTGNITILVETAVPAQSQPFCAFELMQKVRSAEQVGFVADPPEGTPYDFALRMAGGEFCGNATMSAAVLWCARRSIKRRTVLVRVSGAEQPVPVTVAQLPDGGWEGAVEMPRPLAIEMVSLKLDNEVFRLPLVRFAGISHLIATQPMERELAERAVRRWCMQLGADCLGLMLLDMQKATLTPLVYVPAAETLVWESSCASGTAAAGAYLAAATQGEVFTNFLEPGGILGVSVQPDGRIILSGTVKILQRTRGGVKP